MNRTRKLTVAAAASAAILLACLSGCRTASQVSGLTAPGLEPKGEGTEWHEYLPTIRIAADRIAHGSIGSAEDLLWEAPLAYRHWEWGYLMGLCRQHVAELSAEGSRIRAFNISDDGQTIVLAKEGEAAEVWDMLDQSCVAVLAHPEDNDGKTGAAAISPDGKRAILATKDSVHIWAVPSGKKIGCVPNERSHYDRPAFAYPCGILFTPWVSQGKATLRAWNADSGEEIDGCAGLETVAAIQREHPRAYATLNWTRRWIECREGDMYWLIDPLTGSIELESQGNPRYPVACGNQFPYSVDLPERFWDMPFASLRCHSDSTKPLVPLENPALRPSCWYFYGTDDGSCVSSFDWNRLHVWNAKTGERAAAVPCTVAHDNAYELNSGIRARGGRLAAAHDYEGVVRVWDVAGLAGQHYWRFDYADRMAMAVSNSGNLVAVTRGHSLMLLQTETGQKVPLQGRSSGCDSPPCFSHDDRLLVWPSGDAAKVWDVRKEKMLRTISHKWLNTVAVSGDGSRIATGGRNGEVRVWDTESGDCTLTIPIRPLGSYCALALSSQGTHLALNYPKVHGAVIIDTRTGETVQELPGQIPQGWWLHCLQFSRDDTRLAGGALDGAAYVWDLTGTHGMRKLRGHNNAVWSVSFSADGKRLMTSAIKGTVRLWEPATGDEILALGRGDGIGTYRCGVLAASGNSAAVCVVRPHGDWASEVRVLRAVKPQSTRKELDETRRKRYQKLLQAKGGPNERSTSALGKGSHGKAVNADAAGADVAPTDDRRTRPAPAAVESPRSSTRLPPLPPLPSDD